MNHITNAAGAPAAVGAYSQAVCSGDFVFCSGQIGIDPEKGAIVDGGVQAEATQVLKNIEAVLAAAGTDKSKIVMTSIFIVVSSDFGIVNELYASFIGDAPAPARQTVTVKELPLGAQVEISVIARC